ncbi:hypothetical protein KKA14_10625 [bacterium]|nr:hypothetical protein [bacterium]
MKPKIRCLIAFSTLLLFVLFFGELSAKSMFVTSLKVNMTEAPKYGTKALLVLKRGDQVEEMSQDKSWVKVKYNNTSGWVHKLVLSDKPPRKRISMLDRKVDITSKARKRASTFTSAAAARGLVTADKEELVKKEEHDFVALAKIENVFVDPEEALSFINEDE